MAASKTFNALFFKSGYFNDAKSDPPLSNIIGVHPNLALQFSKSISVDGGADYGSGDTHENDAVYGVPGRHFAISRGSQNAPSYIGTALDW